VKQKKNIAGRQPKQPSGERGQPGSWRT